MNVPQVALVPIEDVPEFVGGPELVVVGIFLRVYGKAPSNILFLIPRESAFALVDTLLGRERGETTELDAMDESALMEIGNYSCRILFECILYVHRNEHAAVDPRACRGYGRRHSQCRFGSAR